MVCGWCAARERLPQLATRHISPGKLNGIFREIMKAFQNLFEPSNSKPTVVMSQFTSARQIYNIIYLCDIIICDIVVPSDLATDII